jgi:hypothetical protein
MGMKQFLIPKEKHGLRVSDNRMLRRISEQMRLKKEE